MPSLISTNGAFRSCLRSMNFSDEEIKWWEALATGCHASKLGSVTQHRRSAFQPPYYSSWNITQKDRWISKVSSDFANMNRGNWTAYRCIFLYYWLINTSVRRNAWKRFYFQIWLWLRNPKALQWLDFDIGVTVSPFIHRSSQIALNDARVETFRVPENGCRSINSRRFDLAALSTLFIKIPISLCASSVIRINTQIRKDLVSWPIARSLEITEFHHLSSCQMKFKRANIPCGSSFIDVQSLAIGQPPVTFWTRVKLHS